MVTIVYMHITCTPAALNGKGRNVIRGSDLNIASCSVGVTVMNVWNKMLHLGKVNCQVLSKNKEWYTK